MEPTERKMKVLEAVVESYIRTGEPVGSKSVCDILDFNVSSATVRNDMSELTALGLLDLSSDAPEHLLECAASLLSRITGCAAVASSPSGEKAVIRKIRFVQTGGCTAMTVLVTSTGSVKTKLFRCDFNITPALIEMFESVAEERFVGLPVTGITPALMQSAAANDDADVQCAAFHSGIRSGGGVYKRGDKGSVKSVPYA